jgi:phosphoglycerate dehydrogenase-like enzyme
MTDRVIIFLDDDHVLRLAWFGLGKLGQDGPLQIRDFFAPETIDPAILTALAAGLQAQDGIAVRRAADGHPSLTKDASIIVFRRGTVSAEMIASAEKLRLIQRLGGRSEGIDLAAARAAGVAVSCLPRRTLFYTAEHAILLMLSLAKRLIPADRAVRSGEYDLQKVKPVDAIAYNWPGLTGIGGLYGRTVGIIGLGEVGTLVAKLARAFGMKVVYFNRTRLTAERETDIDVSFRPLDALLAEADFVSLHASNIGPNDRLMGRPAFAAMKPTAFFINTSRGRLVDEDDLFEALTTGVIAGAGLDVHRMEPRPRGDRFASISNVVLTPHLAGGSKLALIDEIGAIFDNIRAALNGLAPPHGRVLP